MGKIINFEDAACIALLYANKANGSSMVSYNKVENFVTVVNKNLEQLNGEVSFANISVEQGKMYYEATNENGRKYLVIDPRVDVSLAWVHCVECVPTEVIMATQATDALDTLGLELVDEKIVTKEIALESLVNGVLHKGGVNARSFYYKVGSRLSPEEKEALKEKIEEKDCLNCVNGTCKLSYAERVNAREACFSWDNKGIIGKYKVLSLFEG